MPGLPAPRPLRQQKPSRRRRRHSPPPRRARRRWQFYAVVTCLGLAILLLCWAALAREFAPQSNTQITRFDAIVVLGYKADSDGNPTPRQLSRVSEGVREYMRGVAPRLILTGGAASNRFVEAESMARIARSEGIPDSAIFIEPQAQDTIQNACFSARIMKAHGWRSAEVVSNAYQLPRAALIFNKLPILWRTHAAPSFTPQSPATLAWLSSVETLKTMRYLVYADWAHRCEP
ncbi:MAG TPA: YdcF family protein [Terracidiphilus sp.]|nr:YdcF family protein [Terracidiphilus sp.]